MLQVCVLLIHVRNFQVDKRHSLLITDALLQVELHQGQHLCAQQHQKKTLEKKIPHCLLCRKYYRESLHVTDHMMKLSR